MNIYNIKNIFLKSLFNAGVIVMLSGLLLLPSNETIGQNTRGSVRYELSLEEALAIAKENNWEIIKAIRDREVAEAEFRQSAAVFLPQIDFSETYVNTNDPMQVFGLKLQQGVIANEDFSPEVLNDPDDIQNFKTRLEFRQPVINLPGMVERGMASDKLKIQDLMKQRTENEVEFEVKQYYFQLRLLNEELVVVETSLSQAELNLQLTRDFFEQGMVQQADVMSAGVRVLELENQLAAVKSELVRINDYLVFLLRIDQPAMLVPSDSLRYSAPPIYGDQLLVPETRSDLKAMEMKKDVNERMLKASRRTFLPEVYAFGGYEFNDADFSAVDNSNYLVGARLQWSLFDGGRKFGAVQKARSLLGKSETEYRQSLEKANLELKNAVRQLKLARKQLEIAQLATEQADASYRIRRDRFEMGLEKPTDLLAAQALLEKQQLTYLQVLYKYQIAIFRLELQLETDLSGIENG